VLADERLHARRADLLLPLEEHLDVDRQPSLGGQHRLEGLEVDPHAALVIDRAARVQPPVADGRLEGRRHPFVQRIDRLHVVMGVDQHRRAVGAGLQPFAVDDRAAGGGEGAHIPEAQPLHLRRDPGGAALQIGPVGRVGADRRDAQEVQEPIQEAPVMGARVVHRLLSCVCHHSPLLNKGIMPGRLPRPPGPFYSPG